MPPLIEMRNISKVFDVGGMINRKQNTALKDVSLAIDENKPTVIAIAGESGSGKTTLARLLLGFMEPSTGEIKYRGKRISEMTRNESRDYRREVQAVFQDPF